MRREEPALLGRRLVAILERGEKQRQPLGRVAGLVGERDAVFVRFVLLRAPEAALDDVVVGGRDGALHQAGAARQRLGGAHLYGLALLNGANGVLLGDVHDLVGQDARQFRLAADERQRPARDVHMPTRRRERVHAVGVEHVERPRQGRPCAALRERGADQSDVAMNAGILHDAVPRANAVADGRAERLLLFLGHLQVAEFAGLLGNRAALADLAQLSAIAFGEGGSRQESRCYEQRGRRSHHDGLTSKIATGVLLPFTITSPRGRISYRARRHARVASLMIIRVPYSLLSDSSRAPRFTASPITV